MHTNVAFTGDNFDSLDIVTPAEVQHILTSLPCKSSPVDFIPTSLLKSCNCVFSDIVANLANISFAQGSFPTAYKTAQVTPLLKKEGLDKTLPANYRPISNLNNISKILERLFLKRIQPHITTSPNFNPFQSAYRRNHSTETSLLYTVNRICQDVNNGKCTLLVSLDLSAAFDTVDHTILSNILKNSFGIQGPALSWINSYLHDRQQFVRIGDATSPTTLLSTGVPQGSVLGPILFTIYTAPIAAVVREHGVDHQQYADDTQLFVSLSVANYPTLIPKLEACLVHLSHWFYTNGLALNPDKTDAILFGTQQRLRTFPHIPHINVTGSNISLADKVKILGVILDKSLSFNDHVSNIAKISLYHIRSLRHIRPSLNTDVAKTIGSAIIGSRLDYANALLFNTSNNNINKLQKIQNLLAKVVLNKRHPTNHRPRTAQMLQDLHWLPIKYRIYYKLAVLTHRSLNGTTASYLSTLISPYSPARTLRSSSSNLLTIPRSRLHFADKSFEMAGPSVWNSLPTEIRNISSLDSFGRSLKTYYFSQAFL